MKLLFLSLSALFLSTLVFASVTKAPKASDPVVNITCHRSTTEVLSTSDAFHLNYCVHIAAGSTSQDVLYYFHGAGGDENDWKKAKEYNQLYQAWGTKAPIVISVSYGIYWLLAEKNKSQYSGLYDVFVNQSLPAIETAENLHPAHRLLTGPSMGGFNAAQVYLKNPQLFTKVALACPALTNISPYDGSDVLAAYIARTHASKKYIDSNLSFDADYFADQDSWLTAAPVSNATQVVNPSYPPLYVSGGLQDQYGFFEGASAFVDAVKAKGAQASWIPIPGKHCVYDIPSFEQFIVSP